MAAILRVKMRKLRAIKGHLTGLGYTAQLYAMFHLILEFSLKSPYSSLNIWKERGKRSLSCGSAVISGSLRTQPPLIANRRFGRSGYDL